MVVLKTIKNPISIARNAVEGSDTTGGLTGRREDGGGGRTTVLMVVVVDVKRIREEGGRASWERKASPILPV